MADLLVEKETLDAADIDDIIHHGRIRTARERKDAAAEEAATTAPAPAPAPAPAAEDPADASDTPTVLPAP